MASSDPYSMMDAMHASMEARTGRTVPQWVVLVTQSGVDPLDQKAVRDWLKNEHGVPMNSQWVIADGAARAAGWQRPSLEGYIDSQYEGAKADLRPIFDHLRALIEGFGDDVRVEGRKTYIPFVRRRQFAAIAAATQRRIDVGLRFSAAPESALISDAKGPGSATHKLSLTSEAQISDEIEALLRMAYEQNG